MTLRSLKTACLLACAITPMVVTLGAKAGNDVEQVQQAARLPVTKDSSWSLRLPEDEKVTYRGVVNLDEAGMGTGSMMYPAPNAAGLLAAVITHGFIVDAQKKAQKDKLQAEADKVLLPYQAVLSEYKHIDLMQRALEKASTGGSKKLVAFSEKPGADWFVESRPVFLVTQDQSAIILDNAISIYAPGAPAAAAYQNVVRVVAKAREETDLASFWTANQGEKLKEESARLFADSLDIAFGELATGSSKDNNAHKTVRYLEGNVEKMERGELVSQNCSRVVIRTLRGWLMSVPARRSAATAVDECGSAK